MMLTGENRGAYKHIYFLRTHKYSSYLTENTFRLQQEEEDQPVDSAGEIAGMNFEKFK